MSAPTPASSPESIIALIPARLASSRLPGKVLLSRTGKPLIQHVVEAARRSRTLQRVVVAADDARVRDAVLAFGTECVMTDPSHPNGTSRLAQAASLLQLPDTAIIVNVQGDEPELEPRAIDAAVDALRRPPGFEMSSVASPLQPGEDPSNPNIVKVVLAADRTALYFSRSLIPHARAGGEPLPPLKHIGLYVYRHRFLKRYVHLPPSPLERCEMLEQLRVLEHGGRIAMAVVECPGYGIDTPEQYEAFVRRVAQRA